MNAHGGSLIIGVDTVGNVLGLNKDYAFVHNKNSDGFEREIRNSIEKYLKDKVADTLIEVRFWPYKEGEICIVIVKPSCRPMVLFDGDKQEFSVRVGNSTKLYLASAMLEYCRRRFKLILNF